MTLRAMVRFFDCVLLTTRNKSFGPALLYGDYANAACCTDEHEGGEKGQTNQYVHLSGDWLNLSQTMISCCL